MIMSVIVIAVVLLVAYLWSIRGFFSAVLHLACVLAGGAVAFAVWEPVSNALLGGGDFIGSVAWGLGLLLPFAVVTGGLSAAVNSVVRANAKCEPIVDIVGGGVCGAGIGLIASGMIALSVSMISSKSDLMGFAPIESDNGGSPVRTGGLWLPADKLVAALYQHASENAFASDTSLARYYPDLADRGHLMKLGPEDATLKFAARPGDVSLVGRYTVNDGGTLAVPDLTKDTYDARSQKVKLVSGEDVTSGQHRIEGYVIAPKAGLRESSSQVVFGNGHLTLLCENLDGTTQGLQPFAMISQAKGDKPLAGRWRFDSKGIFLSSVGGGSEPRMAFEFLVPKDSKPIALYVRGVRLAVGEGEGEAFTVKAAFSKFADTKARDEAIKNGALLNASTAPVGAELDKSGVTAWKSNPQTQPQGGPAVSVSNTLSLMLNKGNLRDIQADDQNKIIGGTAEFFANEKFERGGEKSLIVNKLLVDATTVIVQVNVSPGSDFDLLAGSAAAAEGAPTLVDDLPQPQRHQCVGYLYEDGKTFKIRYTPGNPITSKDELPGLSKSRTDQKLTLFFRCSLGVKIQYFAIGGKAIKEMSPVVRLETPQNK